MKIKDISIENRPRERFLMQGGSALSDAELLAIILQKGSKGENVVDVSNRLLKEGIEELSKLSLRELQAVKGIGVVKALQIKAVFELMKRLKTSKQEGKVMKTAKDVYDYACPKMAGLDREHFMVLMLDTKNKVVKEEVVAG
jgi:DNA repair protein RadC